MIGIAFNIKEVSSVVNRLNKHEVFQASLEHLEELSKLFDR
jgi:hypothetical protein